MLYTLLPHPDRPPRTVRAVTAEVTGSADQWLIHYTVEGAVHLALTPQRTPARADELWMTTCFEAFFRDPITGRYTEFNFSPSLCWAAYAFTARRTGMADLDLPLAPHIESAAPGDRYILSVDLDLSALPAVDFAVSLTAVIEEDDGTRSFWALAHGDGPPDFHDPACFTARLPAPRGP